MNHVCKNQARNSCGDGGCGVGCPKKNSFLNFVSLVELLVRISSQSPRKNFSIIDPKTTLGERFEILASYRG